MYKRQPIYCRRTDAGAVCAIRKDGGDDVDVTTGLPVVASVVLEPDAPGVRIFGGEGVGRVTKPGLDPVSYTHLHHQCDPCAPVSSAFGSISKRHASL